MEHFDIVLRNGTKRNGKIRRALLESGREEKCELCGQLPSWQGKKLTLQIDHIDGETSNNDRSNLRFLCPNCHSQTETFGVGNRKKWKRGYGDVEAAKGENEVSSFMKKCKEEKRKAFTEAVNKLHKSNEIDFSKFGWVAKLSTNLGCHHAYIHRKMKQYMPEFYIQNCFRRHSKDDVNHGI